MDNYLALLLIIIVGFGVYYYCERMVKKEKENKEREIKDKIKNKEKIRDKEKKEKNTKREEIIMTDMIMTDSSFGFENNKEKNCDNDSKMSGFSLSSKASNMTLGSKITLGSHGLFSEYDSNSSISLNGINNKDAESELSIMKK
jgi:hypothetical protein